jgi:hypothetical protein
MAMRGRQRIVGSGTPQRERDIPVTKSDKKLAIKHAKDSIRYNMRHARDHLKAAQKARHHLMEVRRARVSAK